MTSTSVKALPESCGRRGRLILHVGMTKAGSTAIQNYLDHCRSALKARGVLFPATGFKHGNPFDRERTSGHLELVRNIRRGNTKPFESELAETGAEIVVLSAENMLLDRSDDELQAVAGYFYGWEIVVVVVLRNQAAWLQSRYVESVVSGFHMSTLTGREFSAVAAEEGWLDYAKAVERAGSLLSADRTLLLNYESASRSNGLIESFLEIAGIPLTNQALAKSIRSNDRNKSFGLVEVRRRLNYLLRTWPKDARLEFEVEFHKLVDSCQALAAELPRPVEPFQHLSTAQRQTVRASNRELCRKFGLAEPLEEASTDVVNDWRAQHRWSIRALEDLTLDGWKLAVNIAWTRRTDVTVGQHDGGTVFSSLECTERVIDLIGSAQVSLHIGTTIFAVVAASLGRKLPILIPDDEIDGEALIGVLQMKLPSEIICVGCAKIGGVKKATGIIERHPPEVAFVRGTNALEDLSTLFSQLGHACAVVALEVPMVDLAGWVKMFDLKVTDLGKGCIVMLPKVSSHEKSEA